MKCKSHNAWTQSCATAFWPRVTLCTGLLGVDSRHNKKCRKFHSYGIGCSWSQLFTVDEMQALLITERSHGLFPASS